MPYKRRIWPRHELPRGNPRDWRTLHGIIWRSWLKQGRHNALVYGVIIRWTRQIFHWLNYIRSLDFIWHAIAYAIASQSVGSGGPCVDVRYLLYTQARCTKWSRNGVDYKGQGRVVRKPINANPEWKDNQSFNFFQHKNGFSLFMFCIVWDYSNSKLKEKQYKQKTSWQSCKAEIKILAIPGIA